MYRCIWTPSLAEEGRKGCLTEEGPGRVGTGSGWGVLVVTHRASVDPICGVKGRQVVGRGSWAWVVVVGAGELSFLAEKKTQVYKQAWSLWSGTCPLLVYLLFKISFPLLLENLKVFSASDFKKNKRIEKRRERLEKDVIQDPRNHNRGALHP